MQPITKLVGIEFFYYQFNFYYDNIHIWLYLFYIVILIYKTIRGFVVEKIRFISFLEASLLAIIVLVIMFVNTKKYKYKYMLEEKIYRLLIGFNISMLVIDAIRMYVNGIDTPAMRTLNIIFTTLMISFTPVVPMLWSVYVDFKIFMDVNRFKRHTRFLSIPIAINILLVLLSFLGGISGKTVFTIDSQNVYHRNELYIVSVLLNYSYLIYASILLKKNKSMVDAREYKTLKLFIIPPSIGAFVQVAVFGIKLVWFSMTISLVIIFIDVQNKLLYMDSLTGLYNRRNLEKYIKTVLVQKNKYQTLGGILLDINDFKFINDTFGHIEGDNALVSISNVLKKTFDENDFVSRYAGDEFIIITKDKTIEELEEKVIRLDKDIELFNKTSKKPYDITFSRGFHLFENENDITEESFIKKIDLLMYEDKTIYKNKGLTCKF